MDKYLRVHTPMSGFVRIEIATGNLDWESENLDPVAMKYAEKYLVIEGFVELGLVPGLAINNGSITINGVNVAALDDDH